MALVRNWCAKKLGGVFEEIMKECQTLDLKACKKMIIRYDPFRSDVKDIRDFSRIITSYDALKSNLGLTIKTEILTDKSEHSVSLDLINGEKIIMKCGHLTALDLFKLLNEHVTPLAPVESKLKGDSNLLTKKFGKKKKK